MRLFVLIGVIGAFALTGCRTTNQDSQVKGSIETNKACQQPSSAHCMGLKFIDELQLTHQGHGAGQ